MNPKMNDTATTPATTVIIPAFFSISPVYKVARPSEAVKVSCCKYWEKEDSLEFNFHLPAIRKHGQIKADWGNLLKSTDKLFIISFVNASSTVADVSLRTANLYQSTSFSLEWAISFRYLEGPKRRDDSWGLL